MNVHLTSRPVRGGAVMIALGLAVSLAGCGSSGSGDQDASGTGSNGAGSGNVTKVAKLAAMVPDAIRNKGTLVVAGAVYPPAIIQTSSNSAPTGWDIQNAREIAAVLGLK